MFGCLTYFLFNISLILFTLSLLIYGTIFSFLGLNGASHELSHKSVFSNPNVNNFFFYLFSFLLMNNPFIFKKSHFMHHKCSLHEKCDGEIDVNSKFNLRLVLNGIINIENLLRKTYFHIFNFFGDVRGKWPIALYDKKNEEKKKVITWSRLIIFGHSILAICFLIIDLPLLILLISFGHFFGNFLPLVLSRGQHNLMPLNKTDFRENTRTVKLNPILEFLCWNMNYHIEHHMFPKIPFYNLKKLHVFLESDMPDPTKGVLKLVNKLS